MGHGAWGIVRFTVLIWFIETIVTVVLLVVIATMVTLSAIVSTV
jgi:hypothetical protein